tara:strand:- start:4038 stop:4274 length:237 start_codon:yes stop_codon:yes gene_type:complete
MSRLQEKYQKEHAENLAYDKAQLYHEHLLEIEKQEEIDECEGMLITYMGLEEFKKLSKDNLNMIILAMQEYAENKVNE